MAGRLQVYGNADRPQLSIYRTGAEDFMDWLSHKNFDRSERRWVMGFSLVLIFFSTLPYIVIARMTPPGMQYTYSSIFYHDDYFQYYAWANRIAGGDWLIGNYYSSAAEAGFGLFNPFFLLLGWTTRLIGDVHIAYHLWRIIGIMVFVRVSYAFFALFIESVKGRRIAQLLMLGGGLEYPFFYFAQSFLVRPPTPLADPYVFKILYRYGHLTFLLVLLLLIFGTYVSANLLKRNELSKKQRTRAAVGCGVLSLVLGLTNPYYICLVLAVVLTDVLLRYIRTRDRSHFIWIASIGVGGGIALAQYVFQSLASNLGTVQFDDPIGGLDLVLFFGSLGIGIVFWLGWRSKQVTTTSKDSPISFLLVWSLVVLVLVASPLPFKARMVFGWWIALSIPVAQWLSSPSKLRMAYIPIGILLISDMAFTARKEYVDAAQSKVPYIEGSFLNALRQIDELADPRDLVISLGDSGNYIPAYTKANVFVGHSFQTKDYVGRQFAVSKFLSESTEQEKRNFLNRTKARFVLIGPEERAVGPDFDLSIWDRIYERDGFVIYAKPKEAR